MVRQWVIKQCCLFNNFDYCFKIISIFDISFIMYIDIQQANTAVTLIEQSYTCIATNVYYDKNLHSKFNEVGV